MRIETTMFSLTVPNKLSAFFDRQRSVIVLEHDCCLQTTGIAFRIFDNYRHGNHQWAVHVSPGGRIVRSQRGWTADASLDRWFPTL